MLQVRWGIDVGERVSAVRENGLGGLDFSQPVMDGTASTGEKTVQCLVEILTEQQTQMLLAQAIVGDRSGALMLPQRCEQARSQFLGQKGQITGGH